MHARALMPAAVFASGRIVFEQALAALAFLVCALLLARLLLSERRRRRLDAAAARSIGFCRRHGLRLWHWRTARREAKRVAEEAIRRARDKRDDEGAWDGNVYKTKSFRRPRKPH
jgi:hypothetical protein